MNNNFFKKHLVAITVISLIGIIIVLFWLYQGTNDIKKERELGKYPPRGQKLDKTPSLKHESDQSTPSRTKRETEPLKSKFKTTQSHFNQVKAYILSETDDKSLLPKELFPKEKIEIDKIRKSWEQLLEFLKEHKKTIDEEQKKCDDYNRKIQEIKDKFPSLKSQQTKLKQAKEAKNQTIKNLQYQCGEIDPSYAKMLKRRCNIEITNPKSPNKTEAEKLKAEIKKLQDEVQEIVEKIGKIKVNINKLTTSQKYYQDMLSSAENYKRILEKRYEDAEIEYRNQILKSLNSLYNITSDEG